MSTSHPEKQIKSGHRYFSTHTGTSVSLRDTKACSLPQYIGVDYPERGTRESLQTCMQKSLSILSPVTIVGLDHKYEVYTHSLLLYK